MTVTLTGATPSVLECIDAVTLMSPIERQRSERFHHVSDRDDFLAAHALVRLCVSRLVSVSVESVALVQHCDKCGRDDHGKPTVQTHPHVHVSLSHTRGHVAAAASYTPIGVDVERLANEHPRSQPSFLRDWVRREALVKLGFTSLQFMQDLDLSAMANSTPTRWQGWSIVDWVCNDVTGSVIGATPSTIVQVKAA